MGDSVPFGLWDICDSSLRDARWRASCVESFRGLTRNRGQPWIAVGLELTNNLGPGRLCRFVSFFWLFGVFNHRNNVRSQFRIQQVIQVLDSVPAQRGPCAQTEIR